MTTTPEAYLDAMPIDHLDFEPPCGISKSADARPCGRPADWYVLVTDHCDPDKTRSGLMCDVHHQLMVEGYEYRCPTCEEFAAFGRLVIRTERIR